MALKHNKLLFFDTHSLPSDFIDYCTQFAYNIILQDDLVLPSNLADVNALILNWQLISTNTSFLSTLRQQYNIPIIVVNEYKDKNACILSLEMGADDFLIKPINARELLARIEVIARRLSFDNSANEELCFAHWKLLTKTRQVLDSLGNELLLTSSEYELLLTFVRQPQRVLGREFLLHVTKHDDLLPFDRRIDVLISRLRQKIELDVKHPKLIKTIRNGGYLFTAEVRFCE